MSSEFTPCIVLLSMPPQPEVAFRRATACLPLNALLKHHRRETERAHLDGTEWIEAEHIVRGVWVQ